MLHSEKPPKIISKPLPQILDELDANISATAEYAKRAENAARRAEEAAKKIESVNLSDIGAKKYLVVFEKANNNYSAYSPDIPGCIATGKTRHEAERNIREAIDLHIEGLVEDGLPLPEPASSTEYIEV